MPHTVVFICTGNMCRSPMAEGILRHELLARGREAITVSSMGIHGVAGSAASGNAIEVCAENGIDISSHRARQLDFDELKAADLIFVMEGYQKKIIETFVPQVADSLFLLGAWPGKEKRDSDINDPMGGSTKDFRKTFALIKSHIDRIMPALLEALP